jgi:putative ATP-dependent endonuclease of OLD family
MYISKLVIKNYRTFNDFTIDLKPLTLIIGENNIGKSNLLDSIGLIFGQDVSYTKRRILEVGDFNYNVIHKFKSQILDFSIPISEIEYPEIFIETTLKGWDDDQESVICDWFNDGSLTEATLAYNFAPGSRFDRLQDLQRQRDFISKFISEHSRSFLIICFLVQN